MSGDPRGRLALPLLLGAALVAGPAAALAETPEKKPGTVLTFYGLLKMEQDPQVSDEQKLAEWQAFIKRAEEQTVYAKKAVDRWKNAAKNRLVDAAKKADADPALGAREKKAKWDEVARLYPRSKDGRRAKKRAAHWDRMEEKRLVAAAESVEKARRPKVERIRAWGEVVDWAAGGTKRAAAKRIKDLQDQLFSEARSVDKIARVDKRTKLEAWRDVLNGRPSAAQRKTAEARVSALEAELARDPTSMR